MKKVKGIYMVFSDEKVLMNVLPGVYKKIINQLKGFNDSEMSVDLYCYKFGSSIFFKILNILPLELGVTILGEGNLKI